MDVKQFIEQTAEKLRQEMYGVVDTVFEYAELQYKEYKSAEFLSAKLEEHGFTVERGLAEIPTCFAGTWSQGAGGRVMGFLGEFDALDGLSQKAGCTVHTPKKTGAPGHGCGHCLPGNRILISRDSSQRIFNRNRNSRQGHLLRVPGGGRRGIQAIYGAGRAV